MKPLIEIIDTSGEPDILSQTIDQSQTKIKIMDKNQFREVAEHIIGWYQEDGERRFIVNSLKAAEIVSFALDDPGAPIYGPFVRMNFNNGDRFWEVAY